METLNTNSTNQHTSSNADHAVNDTATTTTTTTSTVDPAAAAAAASLQLLLSEDPTLAPLTASAATERVAFDYASQLLHDNDTNDDANSSRTDAAPSAVPPRDHQQHAERALQDVDRKLALVESLSVKLSRTNPEAVTVQLLQLHGLTTPTTTTPTASTHTAVHESTDKDSSHNHTTASTTDLTLSQLRDRAVRCHRQADSLHTTAQRVETVLRKGHTRLHRSTVQLDRVLQVSSALKLLLALQFATAKLEDVDDDIGGGGSSIHATDARELLKAAANVAVAEGLLQQYTDVVEAASEDQVDDDDDALPTAPPPPVIVLEQLRPVIRDTSRAVRRAAQTMLDEYCRGTTRSNGSTTTDATTQFQKLNQVLQIYFHLGELPTAVYQAMNHAHATATTLTQSLLSASTLSTLAEQAKQRGGGSSSNTTATADARHQRQRWTQLRAQVAREWATGVAAAAASVRDLHRVLCRKTDPVRRIVWVDLVLASKDVPPEYAAYYDASGRSTTVSTTKQQQQQQHHGARHGAGGGDATVSSSSLYGMFWARVCDSVGDAVADCMDHPDAAALYPAVRAAAMHMVGQLQEGSLGSSGSGTGGASGSGGGSGGILGGSEALADAFVDWTTQSTENPQAAADRWTRPPVSSLLPSNTSQSNVTSGVTAVPTSSNVSAILNSPDWKMLQGRGPANQQTGLARLEVAFLQACRDRLTSPLKFMFPENVSMDDDGVAIASGLSLLPSKYDLQRFDENIRQELALADPREGGGDLTAVTMITECVVSMISEFCGRAKNAMSGVGETGYLEADWSMTDNLQHDRKVVAIMYTLKTYLTNAPEKVFVAPYRPAVSQQLVDAANLCRDALAPALTAIDNTAKLIVLLPLCRSLNRQVATVLAKMHSGVYLESGSGGNGDSLEDENAPSFVQKELSHIYDAIASKHLTKFPPVYASVVASNVTAYTIYTFLSNASMVRPMGETARLQITQDLADLEMALEQFVGRTGGGTTLTLHTVGHGKPYAELRAVRQLIFWTGLENAGKPAPDVAKSLLRESWTRDLRPSTMFHYLFSFGPPLLSSPHHVRRVTARAYVDSLVGLDGTAQAEDAAWMTIMSCCDSYQQRASAGTPVGEGDTRVAQIVLALGQDLQRRGRN